MEYYEPSGVETFLAKAMNDFTIETDRLILRPLKDIEKCFPELAITKTLEMRIF